MFQNNEENTLKALDQGQASGMDWTRGHSTLISENLKLVEISKNNFNTI